MFGNENNDSFFMVQKRLSPRTLSALSLDCATVAFTKPVSLGVYTCVREFDFLFYFQFQFTYWVLCMQVFFVLFCFFSLTAV